MSKQFLRVDQLQQHAAAHFTEEVLQVGQGKLVVQDEPLSQVVVVVHKAGQESSAHFRQTETSFEEYKVKEIIKVIPTLKLGSSSL